MVLTTDEVVKIDASKNFVTFESFEVVASIIVEFSSLAGFAVDRNTIVSKPANKQHQGAMWNRN
jgi:hypothetical protein